MYSQKSALVMKSNMDGSNETIFADDVYRGDISIMVDESPAKLYLLEWNDDAYRIKIDRISFDGEVKENPCAKASCSGLCLIKPAVSSNLVLDYSCLNINSTSTSDNLSSSSNPEQAVKNNTPGMVAFILVFVVLGILGITGYFIFLKRNWYEYYVALRHWRQNTRDQGLTFGLSDVVMEPKFLIHSIAIGKIIVKMGAMKVMDAPR
ncbi:hypothetical protein U1Q18_051741 [Sarracenia purpurea var. burkii]